MENWFYLSPPLFLSLFLFFHFWVCSCIFCIFYDFDSQFQYLFVYEFEDEKSNLNSLSSTRPIESYEQLSVIFRVICGALERSFFNANDWKTSFFWKAIISL